MKLRTLCGTEYVKLGAVENGVRVLVVRISVRDALSPRTQSILFNHYWKDRAELHLGAVFRLRVYGGQFSSLDWSRLKGLLVLLTVSRGDM